MHTRTYLVWTERGRRMIHRMVDVVMDRELNTVMEQFEIEEILDNV